MKPDVEAALARAIDLRRDLLRRIPDDARLLLLEHLLYDFFVEQRASLLKMVGVDRAVCSSRHRLHCAQHVGSIVLQEPGQGFKGKGLDLADGSEVKSAAIVSGVDRPRWNHDMGKIARRSEEGCKGSTT